LLSTQFFFGEAKQNYIVGRKTVVEIKASSWPSALLKATNKKTTVFSKVEGIKSLI